MSMWTPLLLYLLKANVALLLFAAAYFGLLRRLTFFRLNRAYLVFALLFAAVYPTLPVPALLPAGATPALVLAVGEATAATAAAAPAGPVAPPVDWAAGGVALYAAGSVVLLVRLLLQLLALGRLRARARPAVAHGWPVRVLAATVSPFSFWQTIYLNPALHSAPELAAVLRHEQVHVRQWHTLDVLLAQLALAAAWCNPAAWLLRRALLDNLEYLADEAVLATGLMDRRAYQYSLLRLSHGAAGPSLVSHFTFPTLKNRVVMMNTPLSSTGQLARYFVAGPLVLALALVFSAAQAQSGGPVAPVRAASLAAAPEPAGLSRCYYLDGKPATLDAKTDLFGDVATMKILKGAQVQQVLGNSVAADWAIMITTKAKQNQVAVRALNAKVDAAGALDTRFKMGPAVDPAEHQLPVGIKTYIAKTYPGSTVSGWFIVDKAAEKVPPIRYYYASVKASTGERYKLYFNADEQPVAAPSKAEGPVAPGGSAQALATEPASPQPGKPTPIYYVDGHLNDAANALPDAALVERVSIIKGPQARQLFGAKAADGAIIITTKANAQSPTVLAFNQQMNGVLPLLPGTEAPAEINVLTPKALAYITKTYPSSRIISVTKQNYPGTGRVTYKVELAEGRRPHFALFDEQGNAVKP